MTKQLPIVSYLALGDDPHLVAQECTRCGARYFERRSGCAACEGTAFREAEITRTGRLRTFTVVCVAPPGIEAPFVTGVVDCDGTAVRANVVHVEPDPEHVELGMELRLVTYVADVDDEGTEAIGFAFEPIGGGRG